MPSLVSLVIYLSAAEASDPGSAVIVRSAQEVLGNQAAVTLRSEDAPASDAALSDAGRTLDAAAEITWLDKERRRATVRCYLEKTHSLLKRDVIFDEDADLKERERMLGFVVASMLPSAAEIAAESPAPPSKPEAPEQAPIKSEAHAEGGSVATVLPTPTHFVGLAEVVGVGATGFSGSASGLGAAVGGRWLFERSLSLRVAGGVRRGEIPEASAVSEVEFLEVGLAFELPVSAASRFALGGRASVLVLRHEVDHLSSDDRVPDRQSRILPGADAVFEASWHFSTSAGIVAGAGTELAFGHTDVLVKGKEVTEIPPLRGLAELGIQAKF